MRGSTKISVALIDMLGGVIVLACLGVAAWTIFVESGETSASTSEFRRLLASAMRDADDLRSTRADHVAALAEAREELDARGKLPTLAPVERYFQELSKLASTHHTQVVRQAPLSVRTYPGLREQRYTYEVTGNTGDLLSFLHAIEETEFWADVSHLKIDGESLTRKGPVRKPTAALTISLFSDPADEPFGAAAEGA